MVRELPRFNTYLYCVLRLLGRYLSEMAGAVIEADL